MKKPSGILSVAPEDIKEPLSPEQEKEIEDFKNNLDWDAPKEEEKPEEKGEEVVVIDDKPGEEKTDEEKAAEEEAAKVEEERVAKLAEEKGKTVEEIIQQEADAKAAEGDKTDEQKEQERLEAIAKEEGITVDEVKEAEAKDLKVVENYGNDPKKIAKALRKENSAYGKLKSEHEKLVEFKKQFDSEQAKYNEKRVNADLEAQRDRIVEEYVRLNPEEADDDEAVLFERAKIKVKTALKYREEEANKEVQAKADEARETLVSNIPDEYKEFSPEIKDILKTEENQVVLSEDFDITNLCFWARGKKYTPEYVKGLIEAAEKRGKEQPEILERKTGAVSTGSRATHGGKTVSETASPKDRERALEMFGNKDDWSEQKKIEEYMTNHKAHDNWD